MREPPTEPSQAPTAAEQPRAIRL
ncbi:MAG: hypothetical protein JWM31_1153, partial [Solirubrobacterales bacterium]|nr:hypothetical protein [Solirubrobacterales bacterium]